MLCMEWKGSAAMTVTFMSLSISLLDLPPAAPGAQELASWDVELLARPTNAPCTIAWEEIELRIWPAFFEAIDEVGPIVTYTFPAEGDQLEPTSPIRFDVTDSTENLARTVIAAWLHATEKTEVVWDGMQFVPPYDTLSTRIAISEGYTYFVARTGGWPYGESVTMRVWAVDAAGNEENVPGGD